MSIVSSVIQGALQACSRGGFAPLGCRFRREFSQYDYVIGCGSADWLSFCRLEPMVFGPPPAQSCIQRIVSLFCGHPNGYGATFAAGISTVGATLLYAFGVVSECAERHIPCPVRALFAPLCGRK